jgi:hypothetical protein
MSDKAERSFPAIDAYVVDQSAALDLDVLGVQSILEQLDDIVANRVLAVEALGPGEQSTLVECSLLDGETGSHTNVRCSYHTRLPGRTHLNVNPR